MRRSVLLEQTNVPGGSALYDTNGNKQGFPPFRAQAASNMPRPLLSYGIHLPFNGLRYRQIAPPVVFLHSELFGVRQNTNGLSNLPLTPLIVQSTSGRVSRHHHRFRFLPADRRLQHDVTDIGLLGDHPSTEQPPSPSTA